MTLALYGVGFIRVLGEVRWVIRVIALTRDTFYLATHFLDFQSSAFSNASDLLETEAIFSQAKE